MPATNGMDPTSQWVLQTSNSAPLEQPPSSPAALPRLHDFPLGIHRTTSHRSFSRLHNLPPDMHHSTSHTNLTNEAPSHGMAQPPRQVRCTSSIHVHASSAAGPRSHCSSAWSKTCKLATHRSPDACIPDFTSTFPFLLQHVKQGASGHCTNTEIGHGRHTGAGTSGNVVNVCAAANHTQHQVRRSATMHKPANSIAAAAAQHHGHCTGTRVIGASTASPHTNTYLVPFPETKNHAAAAAAVAVTQGQSDCVSNCKRHPAPLQRTVINPPSTATVAAEAQEAAQDSAAAVKDNEPTQFQKAVWRYKFMKRCVELSKPKPNVLVCDKISCSIG